MVSGHFHKRTAGLMMIHCVQLGFETVQMGERKPKQMEKKDSPAFLFKSEHLDFSKAFPCRDTFKPPRCCAAAMAYPSVILMFGREPLLFLWWIVERALQVLCFFIYLFLAHIFHPRSHLGEHIYYCMDIHYRAAGNTAGKHGSPVAFSSRWKHSSATAAVALETWSLSLFYPHSSPLASLSALLPAIRIKPAAGLAVLKHSLQLNTLK